MKRLISIIATVLFLTNAVFSQVPDEFSFRASYKIATPAQISITTSDGFIHVNSKESNTVEVFFIVKKDNRVVDMDLDELGEHLDVDIMSNNDRLEIKIVQKESNWIKNWKDRYNVSMQINAPRLTSCSLKTSDGNISLNDFEGSQECKTSDGNISVDKVIGNLHARTSDGNINATNIHGSTEMITSDGNINVENIQGSATCKTSDGTINAEQIQGGIDAVTSDGNIFLTATQGDNNARTSDGNIIFESMKGSLKAQTSDGDIRGDLSSLNNSLYLKTSDGDISVTIPDGLGLDLDLKGEDIHTKLENFSGDTSDHHITGKIRGGGISVELITSDGDINLNYD